MTIRRRFYRVGGGGQKALSAFTLIELLVVIAIISLLVSILLPSLNRAKELANRAVCASHLRSIGLGINVYVDDYDEHLPYCVPSDYNDPYRNDPARRTWTSFLALFGYTLRDKYFPWEAMDCPSDVTRQEYIDYWPYFGPDTLNPSYGYNARVIRRSSPPVYPERWPQYPQVLSHWERPADDVLMFEVGRPVMAPNYHAQVGGGTNTGGNYLMVMGELHHGDEDGNNFLFLDCHVSYYTEGEYLETLRYEGDGIYDPNWGMITVNYWAD